MQLAGWLPAQRHAAVVCRLVSEAAGWGRGVVEQFVRHAPMLEPLCNRIAELIVSQRQGTLRGDRPIPHGHTLTCSLSASTSSWLGSTTWLGVAAASCCAASLPGSPLTCASSSSSSCVSLTLPCLSKLRAAPSMLSTRGFSTHAARPCVVLPLLPAAAPATAAATALRCAGG